MNDSIKLIINPLKREIGLTVKSNLLEVFLAEGVKIPVLCNKNGSCGKCRVVVKAEANPVTEVEGLSLGKSLINKGYRLACRTEIHGSGEIIIPSESREDFSEIAYSGSELITIKNREFPYPINRTVDGYSAALDIGTTTLTGYMFDNRGNLLSHCSCFNPTALHGCDVITRIANIQNEEDFQRLRRGLFAGIKRLLSTLCFRATGMGANAKQPIDIDRISRVAVCGNTIMQHIFIGVNPVGVGLFPYKPIVKDLLKMKAGDLSDFYITGLTENAEVIAAPSVSGFIGGDAVCGILAAQLHRSLEPALLIDLGTNGEMALIYNGSLFAASASAGPAFEGYQITSGMRATVGAIDLVKIDEANNVIYRVIGGVKPKGICGTGAISAVSAMLKAGILTEKGHIIPSSATDRIMKNFLLIAAKGETSTGNPVILSDRDIGVIQQAKAAFASGITCLLRAAGIGPEELKKYLLQAPLEAV